MKVGLLTDALAHLSLEEAAGWCAERGLEAVELGVGGYSLAPHANLASLADRGTRDRLRGTLAAAGLELAALNVSGNPLHPDAAVAGRHSSALRGALEAAQALGVPRVIAMSGCPGGPGGGRWPVFAGGAWLPDMEGLWEHQWERIAAYWRGLSVWGAAAAPDVLICLELHPGTSIYNAESYRLLRAATGPNVRVNLDPSHFFWQGIDPLTAIEALGDAIQFLHGKDTLLHPDRIALHGVLDFRWPADAQTMSWHFAAVGAGRPIAAWVELLAAVRRTGYNGVVSIEHEDPNLAPEVGIEASLRGLRAALEQLPANAATAGRVQSGTQLPAREDPGHSATHSTSLPTE